MIPVSSILDARGWAQREFGAADLEDARRTPRLVALAAQVMRHPDASLPEQLQAPKAIKAAYRLLAEEDVTHAAVITRILRHLNLASVPPSIVPTRSRQETFDWVA